MPHDPFIDDASTRSAESERTTFVRVWSPLDRPLPTAVGLGVLIFIVSLALDLSLIQAHWAGPYGTALLSDSLLGILAFVLLYRIFHLGQQRRRQVVSRLESIDEMNHHVRNALQVISFNARASSNEDQLTEIKEAVQRINWTLQVVLPKLEPEFKPLDSSARDRLPIAEYSKSEAMHPGD